MANSGFSFAGVAEKVVASVLSAIIITLAGAIGVGWARVEEWWWAAPVMYALVTATCLYILTSGFSSRMLSGWWRFGVLLGLASMFGVLLYVDSGDEKSTASSSQPGEVGPYQYRNEMTIADTTRFIKQLSELFKQRDSLTFVITAPPESATFESDFRAFIVAACQLADSRCTIENAPDPAVDIDANIPTPKYPGVVIHHVPVSPSDGIITNIMWAMGGFIARKSSHVPEGIARLNTNRNPHFYWFELGSGCPWASSSVCGVSEDE